MEVFLMLFLLGLTEMVEAEVDEELLEKIANDDDDAFEEFYNQTYKALYAFVLSITKNHDNALDIMHDSYIKIKASAHLYKPMGKPLAWVFTIARNLCRDKFNREKKNINLDDDHIENTIDFSYVKDPMDKLVLESALSILSEEESQIVLLFAVEGYKHKEISDLLGIKQNTVISKYNRALKKLREFLEKEESNDG